MAKISIIIPSYNAVKYLKECVESVLNQTLKEIEIIIVDDGSTDASVQMMDDFAKNDPRIKVIHKKNSGYGNSMNRGIAIATGKYIGIVESDDYIVPDMYESLYALTENETVDVVKANFWDCYDETDGSITKVVNRERANMPDVDRAFNVRQYPDILWGHPSIWTGIYRHDFLVENNIKFKEEKGGGWVDNPFFFETLSCAKKIRWTKTPYYCYRKTNSESSSVGYDLKIPFERMCDNLESLEKFHHNDETILKFAYARALMYLVGATNEPHYDVNKDYARPYMQKMLKKMNPDVIMDDFNIADQKTFLKYLSPLDTLMPKTSKILIYNWLPFDNPGNVGGGVTVYCKNLIAALLRYRPDVQVYFISSGWAYDITKSECYVRKIDNMFGERCRTYEIVNSPVPAPQDMLFSNPEVAFENETLKKVFNQFLTKHGSFDVIHFNNIEGLSFDVLSLKEDYPNTKFVFSLHNYVPLCMTGFYYQRHKHCNCKPYRSVAECEKCINRENPRNYKDEMVQRGRFNVYDPLRYDEYGWVSKLGFERLNILQDATYFGKFVDFACNAINKHVDVVLAVSKRVAEIAIENGICKEKVVTSYIGTKVANYQMGNSNTSTGEFLKIAYLGSVLDYEEKGYPFLIKALSRLDEKYAKKIDLVLTTTTFDRDEYIRAKLEDFHSVEIIHGYSHQDLPRILQGVNLGVIPVLWEDNLPQVAIEMVAMGVPVLSSNAGGASELCTSEKFIFEAGNERELLNKLAYFVDNTEEIQEYWNHHNGLVTFEKHIEQLSEIFELPEKSVAEISLEDYSNLVQENEFLYKHFSENFIRVDSGELDYLRNENHLLRVQRDDLQYRLDETWKSNSFKIGRALTYIPRVIINMFKRKGNK